jgi:competence protein ComEA
LESLPYIGPALALRIIAYRQSHGPFKEIAEIQNVPGIGSKTFEQIKDLITTQP